MGCGRLTLRGSVQDGPTRNEHILMHVVHPYAGMHSSSHAFMYTCRQAEPQKWKSYIDIYICIQMYTYICTCSQHRYVYTHMYVCMYVSMCVWTHGRTDVWMYGCTDAWMFRCMDVYVYLCMYACMHVWIHTYACMHVYIYMPTSIYIYTYTYIYAHMHV